MGMLARHLDESISEVLRCVETGERPVVWVHPGVPSEILFAMNLKPFHVMEWTYIPMLMGPDSMEPFIDRATEAGLPSTCCTASTTMAGMLLEGEWPRPDIIVNALGPCDNLGEPLEIARQLFPDTPYYCLDMAPARDEATFEYMADQLDGMIRFLEKETGRSLTLTNLRERAELGNRYWELILEVLDMARARPCPVPAKWFVYNILPHTETGHPRSVRWAEWLHKEARRRLREGKGTSPFEEKLRAVQWSIPPLYNMLGLWEWLEVEYGLSAVCSFFGLMDCEPFDTSTYHSILMGLVRNARGLFMGNQALSPADAYAEDLSRSVENYSADLVIFTDHRGCKNTSVLQQMFREVTAERGVPLLVIDNDAFDGRITPDEEMRRRIAAFLETRGLVGGRG